MSYNPSYTSYTTCNNPYCTRHGTKRAEYSDAYGIYGDGSYDDGGYDDEMYKTNKVGGQQKLVLVFHKYGDEEGTTCTRICMYQLWHYWVKGG